MMRARKKPLLPLSVGNALFALLLVTVVFGTFTLCSSIERAEKSELAANSDNSSGITSSGELEQTSDVMVNADSTPNPEPMVAPIIAEANLSDSREIRIERIREYLAERDIENNVVAGVNLATQNAWVYKNGEIIWESPVVTAYSTIGYATPTGIYHIFNKLTDHALYGDKWCNYWIGFNYDWAEGFHDAQWRDEFGGDIYLTDGSMGCVNTPLDAMEELYGLLEVGDIVWVHDYPELL
jgi:lipoprotein-anchoring transpeptidase ErfK/SrfK